MIFDTLQNIKNYKELGEVYTALTFLAKTDFSKMAPGKYEIDGDRCFYSVQEYETDPDKKLSEAHKKYIDIQYMIDGEEIMGIAPLQISKVLVEEKEEKDCWLYECDTLPIPLQTGYFAVLYPTDIHKPGVAKVGKSKCRKVVVKVHV